MDCSYNEETNEFRGHQIMNNKDDTNHEKP